MTTPVKLAFVVTLPAVKPEAVPVIFVPTKADGVPSAGVTSVGLVASTTAPEPVEDANDVALPIEVTTPVRLALVVTLPAVSPEAVPVMFVPTKADGVPRAGVTKVGLVAKTTEPEPVDVVLPVPPLAIGKADPDKPIASVPLVVIGEPVTDRKAGTVAATDVTVPEPPATELIV